MPFYFAKAGSLLKESRDFILNKYRNNLYEVTVLVPNVCAANQLAKLFVSKEIEASLLPQIIPIEEIKTVGNKIVALDKGELANYFEHQLIITKIISSSKYYNFNLRQALELSKSILVLLHEFMKSGREPKDLSKLHCEHFLQLHILAAFLQEVKDKWLLELSRHQMGDVIDVCLKNCGQLAGMVQKKIFESKLVVVDVTEKFCWGLIKSLYSAGVDMIIPTFGQDLDSKTKCFRSNITELLAYCDAKVADIRDLLPGKSSFAKELRSEDNISYQVFPNDIKELNFVANLLFFKAFSGSYSNIAVVLDDLEMIHTLVQILQGYNVGVKNLVGLSLTRNLAIQFLLLIVRLQKQTASVKDFIALLKHPYCASKISENFEHLAVTQGLILQNLEEAKVDLKDRCDEVYQIYVNAIFINKAKSSFRSYLKSHLEAAELLFPLIWQSFEYIAVHEYIENLFNAASYLEEIEKEEYCEILAKLLQGKYYADSSLESKIYIVSPKDMAFLDSQFVVVPNFHDSSWPNLGDSDVWLSDNIRSELGLSDVRFDQLENYRGYFANVISFPEVLFTRSHKSGGKDTIESRFWSQDFNTTNFSKYLTI